MTSRRPAIALAEVTPHVRRRCFSPGGPELIGAELEWLTTSAHGPGGYPAREQLHAIESQVVPLAGGSKLTMEPGGQLELSSTPATDITSLTSALARDAEALSDAAAAAGVTLIGAGMHPDRGPERLLDTPRYAAMENYYDRRGPAGRRMMCNTAAIQINLDLGSADRMVDRWRLAHSLGPVLGAVFANSPLGHGRPTGWRSTRLSNWWEVDPTRTLPVEARLDPIEAWATYSLDADVMLIRGEGGFTPLIEPLSFRRWIAEGHELGYPTWDDFEYHLTTLFPPVRPRGWLELRMIDALPGPMWRVALAVTAALFYDRRAAASATEACLPASGRWADAFRFGLQHPLFRSAGETCLRAAIEALERTDVSTELVTEVRSFSARYTEQGITPADEALSDWISGADDKERGGLGRTENKERGGLGRTENKERGGLGRTENKERGGLGRTENKERGGLGRTADQSEALWI